MPISTPPTTSKCPWCGGDVLPDAPSCHACDRLLEYVCPCGAMVPVQSPRCPHCDRSARQRRLYRMLKQPWMHKLAIVGLVGVAAGVGAWFFQGAAGVQERLKTRGTEALAQGAYENASGLLGDYLVDHPDDAEARYLFALARYGLGDVDSAASELEEAIDDEPRLGNAHLLLGADRIREGRLADALSHLRRANPERAEAVAARARRLLDAVAQMTEPYRALSAGSGAFGERVQSGMDVPLELEPAIGPPLRLDDERLDRYAER